MPDDNVMAFKLTKAHFKKYVKYVKKWIKYWGISEYAIHVIFEEIEDGYGMCAVDDAGGIGIIGLNPIWDVYRKPTDENLDLVAFHEVCELLLARMWHLALEGEANDKEVMIERHKIIRRMEHSVFHGGK